MSEPVNWGRAPMAGATVEFETERILANCDRDLELRLALLSSAVEEFRRATAALRAVRGGDWEPLDEPFSHLVAASSHADLTIRQVQALAARAKNEAAELLVAVHALAGASDRMADELLSQHDD